MRLTYNTLITDFDNTLYNWFHFWHQSFRAMLDRVVEISGIDEETLLSEIRTIHQRNHTSEYAFLLEEIPSLRAKYGGKDILCVFDDAIHAYRSARKRSLVLYDGVKPTLEALKQRGVLLVIYTESLAYYTNDRIRRLELDGLVDFVFSPPDHDIPASIQSCAQEKYGPIMPAILKTKHVALPKGIKKPNPEVLLDIVQEVGRRPEDCIYVGDSLMKDVAMAQQAGVMDVFAEYGKVQHLDEYELLRKVSHWTEQDVANERRISEEEIKPTRIISNFNELSSFF